MAPLSLTTAIAALAIAAQLAAQTVPPRSPERIRADYEAHQGDFDYLLGDWAFTATSLEFGPGRGYWSANAVLDQWELVSAEAGTGLHNTGTGHKVGAEMHIEQRFGVMGETPSILRIRYYDIRPDRFSWTADRSLDGGKTWERNHLRIEARRIGPARSLGPLAPARE